MYTLDYTGRFKKDVIVCQRRGYDLAALQRVIKFLEEDGQVPQNYKPHKLSGKLSGFWECHIESNWLLIYDIQDTIRLVSLVRTGTHSDLLSKK